MTKQNTLSKKAEEARLQVERIEVLSSIYENLLDSFNWNFCVTGEKDENGEYIFKEMEKPDGSDLWEAEKYRKMLVWKEVLKTIEKMA